MHKIHRRRRRHRMKSKKEAPNMGFRRDRACRDGHGLDFPVFVFGTGEAGEPTTTFGRKLVTNSVTADQYPGWMHVSSIERARERGDDDGGVQHETKKTTGKKKVEDKKRRSPITHCAFLRETRCTCSPRPQGREGAPCDWLVPTRRLPSRLRPLRIPPRRLGTSGCAPNRRRPLAHDCE